VGTFPKREFPDWEGGGVPNFSEKKISRYGADFVDREPLTPRALSQRKKHI
jgi:hypothetical protein